MQTKEPRKRINWIFVIVLIIVIPLIIIFLIMMNTVSSETESLPQNKNKIEDTSK
jgi:predicted PurR-regulated permease PerM